jgi:hypothetical protein
MRFPLLLGLVPAVLVAFAVGCSPSAESGGVAPDGGSPTGEGGTTADGGATGDSAAPASCDVVTANVLGDDIKELSNLQLAGASLVFLSADLTLATPPAIEKIQQDGTGRTTLYTPAGDRRVHSLHVQGDRVLFLEQDNAATIPAEELWSIPLAGGTATRLGTATFDAARIIGSDATHLYVWSLTSMPVGTHFDRVDLVSGVVENVAISTDRGGPGQVTLSGNDIFFFAGKTGGDASISDIFRFAKTGSGVTPTILPGGTDALCDSRLGGIYATPTKLACGFGGVKAADRDGANITVVVPRDLLHPASRILVGSDAETLYVMDREGQQAGTGKLYKVASSGGALAPVACDMSEVQSRLLDAVFPLQTEHELVIGATDTFWIEHRGLAPSTKWFIRHVAK